MWAPKSSSSSSSSSPSSLLSPPPPPAASSSSSDDVTTNTPNAKAQSKVEGAAEAGRGAVTVGGGAAEGSGKRRAREAYLKSNDEGDVGNSEVLGAAALEVEKGEVEPKGKQQRSRKRNKVRKRKGKLSCRVYFSCCVSFPHAFLSAESTVPINLEKYYFPYYISWSL